MTEYRLEHESGLGGFGGSGFDSGVINNVRLVEETGLAVVAATLRGGDAKNIKSIKSGFERGMRRLFDAPPPKPGQMVVSGGTRIIASALGQCFIIESGDPKGDPKGDPQADPKADPKADSGMLEAKCTDALSSYATITDQSDGWVLLRYTGARVYEALERLSMLDTSPEAFPIGSAMRSSIHHINAIICRDTPAPNEINRFLFLTPRSTARSFLATILDTVPFSDA